MTNDNAGAWDVAIKWVGLLLVIPCSVGSCSSDNPTPSSDTEAGPSSSQIVAVASVDAGAHAAHTVDADIEGQTSEMTPLAERLTPRLTRDELNHAVRDLLNDHSAPALGFVAEDEFAPFDNDATRQTVSSSLVDSMQALAEDVAERVAHDSTVRSSWMPCEPVSSVDESCFDATVSKLSRSFFRREVTQDDIVVYRQLLQFAEEQDDFYVAVELLITSLLQDPEFLYRLERTVDGAPELLDAYGVATRLAFLLWGSPPDESLLNAAADGQLTTPGGRRVAAERLFADERAQLQLYRFHAMWLGYRAIPHDTSLISAFQLETEKLIERTVFTQPQNYLHLFTSTDTYLTRDLAAHYDLPAPAGEEGWVQYPTESARAGILSHGSVLSGFSKFSDTSPTQRGIFVRTRLMCLPVPPPPPSVDVDQPPEEDDTLRCKVDRYQAHREQSGCADCHQLFEPIGQGLEQFDRAGRFREHDEGDIDCAIEATGTLPGVGEFSGPAELAQMLTQNGEIDECFVRHYLQYAYSTGPLSATTPPYAGNLVERFRSDATSLKDWILSFVGDEQFVSKSGGLP